MPKRLNILDTPVDCVDMSEALSIVDGYLCKHSQPGTILSVNPEKVYTIRKYPFLKEFFDNAVLLLPDGIGIVKALTFLYHVRVSRVPGADLMQNICALAQEKGYRIFIYGATEEVNKCAVDKLSERYPRITIAGRANGYIKADNMDSLVEHINETQPDILFIALGSPRQEQWIQEFLPRLNIKLCQCIGGTLDTLNGNVKRAPAFFQSLGLEWLYRLVKQPTRWKRQLTLVHFVFEVIGLRLRKNNASPHIF